MSQGLHVWRSTEPSRRWKAQRLRDGALSLIERKERQLTRGRQQEQRGRDVPRVGSADMTRLEDAAELGAQSSVRQHPADRFEWSQIQIDALADKGRAELRLEQR